MSRKEGSDPKKGVSFSKKRRLPPPLFSQDGTPIA